MVKGAASSARAMSLGLIGVQIFNIVLLTAFIVTFVIVLLLARRPIAAALCPVNTCPVNRFTFEKDCSNLSYNTAQEECIPRNSCQSTVLPCSFQLDGSTACPGSADAGLCPVVDGVTTECDCTSRQYCANYIRSFFVPYTFNGIPYFSTQTGTVETNATYTWNAPLDAGFYKYNRRCTLNPAGLDTVIGRSCISGHLTQFSDGPEAQRQYGCAIGEGCGAGFHQVWDYTSGLPTCQVTSFWPSGWA